MHEILYLLRAVVVVFIIILVYGIVSLLITPISYDFAEPFVDIGIFLFFPFSLLLPSVSDLIMGYINHLEMTISGGNGIFLVFFMVMVVAIYTGVLESLYQFLKKKDKKNYHFEI